MLKKIISRYLPIFLLCTVFIFHFVRGVYFHQSPWKGGGFGMFADIDGGFLRVYVDHKGRQIPMVLPLSLKKFENRFLVFPSDHNLKKLAHQVSLKRYWQKDQEVIEEMKRPGFLLPGPASFYHDAHEIKLNSLIVEYWKYHFDFKSGKVKANRVKRKVYSFENIKLAKNKL